jgi:hypothetical protein
MWLSERFSPSARTVTTEVPALAIASHGMIVSNSLLSMTRGDTAEDIDTANYIEIGGHGARCYNSDLSTPMSQVMHADTHSL